MNKGPLVSFCTGGGGGGSGRVSLRKFGNFKALKMLFSAFWRLNLRTKEHVFHSRQCSFQFISHSDNIHSCKQWTNDENHETKLCILNVNKFYVNLYRNLWKNDWNIGVHLTKALSPRIWLNKVDFWPDIARWPTVISNLVATHFNLPAFLIPEFVCLLTVFLQFRK